MSRAERADGGWRGDRLAFGLLAGGVLGSLPFLVHGFYDPVSDAGVYLLLARALHAGEGYRFLGAPFVLRPPGFPLLLAPFADASFAALNAVVALFGAAAVLLLFAFARPRIGGPLAAVVAAGVWLLPAYQALCNQVMSDLPALAALLGCCLWERRCGAGAPLRREVGLGVALAAAVLLRTILLPLLPAIALSRLLREWPGPGGRRRPARFLFRRCAVFSATALMLLAPWSLYARSVAVQAPADQTRAASYATGMWHTDQGDPDSPRIGARALGHRFATRTRQIAAALGSHLQTRDLRPAHVGWAALLLGSLAIVAVRRREPAEIYCLLLVAALSVYFGFGPRLVLPVYVLAWPCAAELLQGALRAVAAWGRASPAQARRLATLGSAAVVALALCARAQPRGGWEGVAAHQRRLLERVVAVTPALEPGERVASARGVHYAVMLHRPVFSLEYAVDREGPDAGLPRMLEKYAIDRVVLAPEVRRERELVPWFDAHYGPAEVRGPVRLYRIDGNGSRAADSAPGGAPDRRSGEQVGPQLSLRSAGGAQLPH